MRSFRRIFLCLSIFILSGCTSPPLELEEPKAVVGDNTEAIQPHVKTSSAPGGRKMVAVQALLFDCATFEELEERIAEMKQAGVDTLIFRVFHNRGDRYYPFAAKNAIEGVYFASRHSPVVDDILGRVIEIAHRHDMALFAWMTTRYAEYGVRGRPGWQEKSYDLEKRRFVGAPGLNLFNRPVRDHLIGLYRDLAAYDIDGILLQDDLILKHTEGFSEEARNAFAAKFGRMPDPDLFYRKTFRRNDGRYLVETYGDDFWVWSRWKSEHLLDFAGVLMQEVKAVRPNMKFALNFMYEAALKPRDGLAWLSQDLDAAVKRDFDLYAIMAYHRQMSEELGLSGGGLQTAMEAVAQNALQKVGAPEKLLIKLQVMDWNSREIVSHEEIEGILSGLKSKGINTGYAFVPYQQSFNLAKVTPLLMKDVATPFERPL